MNTDNETATVARDDGQCSDRHECANAEGDRYRRAHRAISRQHVARPVWPMATHQGKLTARRLVITFVATTGRKLER
jgi:hypothetical protein